jgi:hypothetical protein
MNDAASRESEAVFKVLWPSGKEVIERVERSHPMADLNGKTIAEVWDWRFRGDEMFAILREELRKRYPDVKFVDYSVFGNTHGPQERQNLAALPDLLHEHGCDVVISGIGA